MLNTEHFDLVAGEHVLDIIKAERDSCPAFITLPTHQKMESGMGYRSAELCFTLKGTWTLRHASGLQNFAIIRKGFATFDEAVEFAKDWCGLDVNRRYAFVRKSALEQAAAKEAS